MSHRKNILLVEPEYNDKYPPLGLMKISTFHKLKGDSVMYYRGKIYKNPNFFAKIYISTRFSFHWEKTKELILYYKENYNCEIQVGGIHASINPSLYEIETSIYPHIGSLKGEIHLIIDVIKKDEILSLIYEDIIRYGIDALPPDYSLFDKMEVPFEKILKDNYLLRATKGCKRNCSFCDVKKICEGYNDKLPIEPIIKYIDIHFGKRKNILFFDDNTLFSSKLDEIVTELCNIGFYKGAKFNNKKRYLDFNQGMDLRLITDEKLQLINKLAINPVRFAFDNISQKNLYIEKIQKVIEFGIRNISVYVLYNYQDTPEDFYERIRLSSELNNKYNCRIFSFPMKYVPNNGTDRTFVGENWNKRMIRSLQCILNSTHGIVPVNYNFFTVAFGKDEEEFLKILHLPEDYIIYRKKNKSNIEEWESDLKKLTLKEKEIVYKAISKGKNKVDFSCKGVRVTKFLSHYINE